jgi:hypothetical protein
MIESRNLKEAGLAGTLAFAVVFTLFVFTFNGEITRFFHIGDVLPLSPFLKRESVQILEGQLGYDGQLFLTIALDPTLKSEGTIKALDNPRYRYRRIGYPLAGYILGLGRPHLIPYALVGLNLFCIPGLVLLISLVRVQGCKDDKHAPSALWLVALPGVWVCLYLTTSDLFVSLLFVAALLLLELHRHLPAAVILCAACLTRETYLAATVAVAGLLLFRRGIRVSAPLFLSIVPPLVWIVFVNTHIQTGTIGVRENLALPITGIITKLRGIIRGGASGIELFEGYCFALLLIATALATISVIQSRKSLSIAHIAMLPYIAILITGKMQILEYHANYLRIFLDIWIMLLLVPGPRWFRYARRTLLSLSGVASLVYVLNYI